MPKAILTCAIDGTRRRRSVRYTENLDTKSYTVDDGSNAYAAIAGSMESSTYRSCTRASPNVNQ